MKKILAMVMAIVMMMAIAVPSFAAVQNTAGDEKNTVDVTVDGDSATEKWTVTIPADISLTWGDTATAKTYEMDCQLKENRALVVSAAVSKLLTSDSNETIEFTLSGDVDAVESEAPVYTATRDFSVDVDKTDWDAATIADYTGTITFTATVIDKV